MHLLVREFGKMANDLLNFDFNVLLSLDKGEKSISREDRNVIWSSLPIIYCLVILKHLKHNSVLLKNESNQQRNQNS